MKVHSFVSLLIIFCLCTHMVLASFTIPGLDAEIPDAVIDHIFDDIESQTPSDHLGTFQYSPHDAGVFARLSSAAYCSSRDKNRLDNWTCQACQDSGIHMTRVSKFIVATTDMYGYVAYCQQLNRIFLVFRGSSNIANWMTNLDFGYVDYDFAPGIKVHGGFMKAYKFARPIIVGILDSFFYDFPTASLSISGHSLAGAIATHAVADFASGSRFEVYDLVGVKFVRNGSPYDDELPFDHSQLQALSSAGLRSNTNLLTGDSLTAKYGLHYPMYTFGAPRVGDTAWATWFKQITSTPNSVFRIVHNQDPVPHLPPMSMGFKHYPTEVYYNNEETEFVVCDSVNGEDGKCSNQHWLPTNIDNHLVYLQYPLGSVAGAC